MLDPEADTVIAGADPTGALRAAPRDGTDELAASGTRSAGNGLVARARGIAGSVVDGFAVVAFLVFAGPGRREALHADADRIAEQWRTEWGPSAAQSVAVCQPDRTQAVTGNDVGRRAPAQTRQPSATRPGAGRSRRGTGRGRLGRTVLIGLAILILVSVAVGDAATSPSRTDGALSPQDGEFLGHVHGYGLPDGFPQRMATFDARRFCSELTFEYWGPDGAFWPEAGHAHYFGRYRDMRAIWLAATRTYCRPFQRSVHGVYEERGKPVYGGSFDGASGQPLPYDYPEGGLCLSRYNNWADFGKVDEHHSGNVIERHSSDRVIRMGQWTTGLGSTRSRFPHLRRVTAGDLPAAVPLPLLGAGAPAVQIGLPSIAVGDGVRRRDGPRSRCQTIMRVVARAPVNSAGVALETGARVVLKHVAKHGYGDFAADQGPRTAVYRRVAAT
ncbi:hypothetical protein [Phytohabitans rumicis]|uniref:Uncharacterized protein n=1 Tax=Phytohabitans rumicis TaxID=1076125 RepID=A0A6V8LF78_9ACTN|nr:hypothetical protein [Phytohabitans rumicis]GFJ93269.1 hypothetical protein Prum_069110 [Phytohabitans rumicis]